MINLKPIITASAVLLLLNACSSDSTTAIDATEISVLAISGATVGLNGTYSTGCHGDGDGSSNEVLEIAGNTWNYTNTSYTDGICTAGAAESAIAATFSAGADTAITGWVDGMEDPTTAPEAADVSGPLSDTESVTTLTLTIVSGTGDYADIAGSEPYFYVVDDTGTNNILYRPGIDRSTLAGNFDPLIKQ